MGTLHSWISQVVRHAAEEEIGKGPFLTGVTKPFSEKGDRRGKRRGSIFAGGEAKSFSGLSGKGERAGGRY